jgi:predicted dehydrogenase
MMRAMTNRCRASRCGRKPTTAVKQLVADPAIDAVYIATPPSSHKPLSLLVAKAGKHVYVEKPMAMRFEECREIVEAASSRACGCLWRFTAGPCRAF